jgi:hypothetical protein
MDTRLKTNQAWPKAAKFAACTSSTKLIQQSTEIAS